jgi:hypothetical protein
VESDQLLEIGIQLSNAWSDNVTIPFTVTGTAQNGSGGDFITSGSPVVIPVGWTYGTIQVQLSDDDMDEELENILITMGEIVNGTPGSLTSHQILITDNDSPPEVFFTSLNKSREEDTGVVTVEVGLSSTSVHTVDVPLVLSGSATQGGDYSVSTTNLAVPAGSVSETFEITVVDDSLYDPNEKVVVTLGTPTNAGLGSPSTFTLNIEDNDLAPCEVGTYLLSVGTDSINLSLVNAGQTVTLTGGSVTWPEAIPNQPRLNVIKFSGAAVFSGSEKPTSYTFFAWDEFSSLATESLNFEFDSSLGSGDHVLVAKFQNLAEGTTCSVTEIYTNP